DIDQFERDAVALEITLGIGDFAAVWRGGIIEHAAFRKGKLSHRIRLAGDSRPHIGHAVRTGGDVRHPQWHFLRTKGERQHAEERSDHRHHRQRHPVSVEILYRHRAAALEIGSIHSIHSYRAQYSIGGKTCVETIARRKFASTHLMALS